MTYNKKAIQITIEKTVRRLFIEEERGPGLHWYDVHSLADSKEAHELMQQTEQECIDLFNDTDACEVQVAIYIYYCERYIQDKLPGQLNQLESDVLFDLQRHDSETERRPHVPTWVRDR